MNYERQRIAELLRTGRRVLFITGAGVSAESGIPTFRGATGAFADGLTEEGIPFEDVLSGTTLRRNPGFAWKYFFRMEQAKKSGWRSPTKFGPTCCSSGEGIPRRDSRFEPLNRPLS
jgi:NAD-dependent SIR2 family protein deacetylase